MRESKSRLFSFCCCLFGWREEWTAASSRSCVCDPGVIDDPSGTDK